MLWGVWELYIYSVMLPSIVCNLDLYTAACRAYVVQRLVSTKYY